MNNTYFRSPSPPRRRAGEGRGHCARVSRPRTHRTLLVALLVACSLASSATVIAAPPATSTPARKLPAPARFESEIAGFEKWDHQNAPPRDPILFVGSSTIRLWQTADSFPDLPVINRGFGGSQTSDVNHFADRIVFKYKPRVIVFYAGDNDIAAGKSPDSVFADIETFRKRMHDRLPTTRLIYLAIKPSPARWKLWPQMQSVNSRVKSISEKVDFVTYIDTAAPILGSDGQPQKDLFRDDSLHMNPKGYASWNEILRPVLAKSLPPR